MANHPHRHFYFWCPNCRSRLHLETAEHGDHTRGVENVPWGNEPYCPLCGTKTQDWDTIAAHDERFLNHGTWEDFGEVERRATEVHGAEAVGRGAVMADQESRDPLALAAEAEALCAAATPGPWEDVSLPAGTSADGAMSWESPWRIVNGPPQVIQDEMLSRRAFTHAPDARLIARARTLLPELTTALRRTVAGAVQDRSDYDTQRIALYRQAAQAEQERDDIFSEAAALHGIVRACIAAVGNGSFAAPGCSVEFLRDAPNEIRLEITRLRALCKEALDHLGRDDEPVPDVGHSCTLGVTDCDGTCADASWAHRRNQLRAGIRAVLRKRES